MSSRAAMMHDSDQNDKSWFQRQKDKVADHKERRAKRKAEERKQRAEQEKQIRVSSAHSLLSSLLTSQIQVEQYRKKRAELMQGQHSAQGMGLSSRYAAPSMAYSSPMGLGPSYGYGKLTHHLVTHLLMKQVTADPWVWVWAMVVTVDMAVTADTVATVEEEWVWAVWECLWVWV
jgi:hypothetical protein